MQADLLRLIKTVLISDERSDDITAEADNESFPLIHLFLDYK